MSETTAATFNPADAWGLEALLISRVRLYTLFHKLFGGNTTPELIDELLGQGTQDAIEEVAGGAVEMQNLLGFLNDLRKRDRSELADAAKDEYTRQFVGPGTLPAPATESPYLTRDASTVQENTLLVRMEYRMYGLQAKRFQRVPEDHVAMMCSFMASRAKKALQLLRAGTLPKLGQELYDERAFVVNHMANWLPEFAKLTRNHTKTTVMFPQLIEPLSVFVGVDATMLAEGAYWAEQVELPEAGMPGLPDKLAESFAQAEQGIGTLEAIRLVGLEDVELIAVEN
jgi:TorA maturation chaperone TorD